MGGTVLDSDVSVLGAPRVEEGLFDCGYRAGVSVCVVQLLETGRSQGSPFRNCRGRGITGRCQPRCMEHFFHVSILIQWGDRAFGVDSASTRYLVWQPLLFATCTYPDPTSGMIGLTLKHSFSTNEAVREISMMTKWATREMVVVDRYSLCQL